MGQSLNCFAKHSSSSLTLAGDLSGFPDGFEGESYHRTEDPYKDSRSKFEHGYNATFYSNKDEDKHILVHDRHIGFEIGKGRHRRCPNNHIYNKTMKVEGNKLVVVDAQPVEDTKPVEDTNTGWRSSNGGIKF